MCGLLRCGVCLLVWSVVLFWLFGVSQVSSLVFAVRFPMLLVFMTVFFFHVFWVTCVCFVLLCCLSVGYALVFVLAALVACVLCVLGCIVAFFL